MRSFIRTCLYIGHCTMSRGPVDLCKTPFWEAKKGLDALEEWLTESGALCQPIAGAKFADGSRAYV